MSPETTLNTTEKEFLLELYQQSQGDQSRQFDTTAIGATVGVDKTDARKISEELIGHGFVEVKTLSGGIGITGEGLAAVQQLGLAATAAQTRLENRTVITSDGRKTIENVLEQLKNSTNQSRFNFDDMAELVIDIKTIEVQLLSPKPKTAVIKACLASMLSLSDRVGIKNAGLIQSLIGD